MSKRHQRTGIMKNEDLLSVFSVLLAFLIAALPFDVWAAAPTTTGSSEPTLGLILCNLGETFAPLAKLMAGFAYIGGAVLAVRGTMFFKKHTDNPNDSQIVKAIAHVLSGGALAALPSAVGAFQDSLHITLGSGGLSGGCTPGAGAAGSSAAVGLDMMMENFVKNIQGPMAWLVSLLGVLVGVFYIYRGLLGASKIGSDPRAGATHVVLVHLIVGAILISLSSMLNPVLESIFGSTTRVSVSGIIDWNGVIGGGANFDRMDTTVAAMLTFVKVLGAISFLRGWMILKKAVEGGQATIPQGVTHIIGGAMAINIGYMLKIFDSTFGTGLVN